jgi:KDO2-lipid IV(A) lauroyltransferase
MSAPDPTKPPFQIGDFLLNLLVHGIIRLVLLLPYERRVPVMGWLVQRVIGPVAGYRRRALDNLEMIWPDMPKPARTALAAEVLDNVGRSLIENYSFDAFKARMAKVLPHGPGLPVLEASRGAVLVSGHFGNSQAARACLLARGLPLASLYRPMSNPYFNAHYTETLAALGGPIFAKGRQGLGGFMRHLRQGGTVAMLFDLRVADGVAIPFLGRPALTTLSPAEMALRYGVPLIPLFATRKPDGLDFDIVIEDPIPPGTPLAMMTELTARLEARVMGAPGQWFWVHRRWK